MIRQLDSRKNILQAPLNTIFIGGGTPTALPDEQFETLLAKLAVLSGENTEFSVEANCNSLDDNKIQIMRRHGVSRLSIGVQSFDDNELKLLGRLHTGDQAKRAIANAASSGFVNISVDLIYGIPGQSMDSWRTSLLSAIDSGIKHLSCYCLDYPQSTELARRLDAGDITAADEQFELECYHLAREICRQNGLSHYEISNFAAEGYRCQHNLNYWHNGSYAAMGPGAVACVDALRYKNIADIDAYIACMETGRQPIDGESREKLTGPSKQAETLMLELRLIDGVELEAFKKRFGQSVTESFPQTIARNTQLGLLEINNTHMKLTEKALFISDCVLADFVEEAAGK